MKKIIVRVGSRFHVVALFVAIVMAILVGPLAHAALALTVPAPNNIALPQSPIGETGDVTDLLCGILVWIFWGLIIFAIGMFLVGGYRYATSAGEPENVKTANKILLYAAIAVVVALVAQGVPYLVSSFMGGDFITSVC